MVSGVDGFALLPSPAASDRLFDLRLERITRWNLQMTQITLALRSSGATIVLSDYSREVCLSAKVCFLTWKPSGFGRGRFDHSLFFELHQVLDIQTDILRAPTFLSCRFQMSSKLRRNSFVSWSSFGFLFLHLFHKTERPGAMAPIDGALCSICQEWPSEQLQYGVKNDFEFHVEFWSYRSSTEWRLTRWSFLGPFHRQEYHWDWPGTAWTANSDPLANSL